MWEEKKIKNGQKYHVPIYQNVVDRTILRARDQSAVIAGISDGRWGEVWKWLLFSRVCRNIIPVFKAFCFITFLSKTRRVIPTHQPLLRHKDRFKLTAAWPCDMLNDFPPPRECWNKHFCLFFSHKCFSRIFLIMFFILLVYNLQGVSWIVQTKHLPEMSTSLITFKLQQQQTYYFIFYTK